MSTIQFKPSDSVRINYIIHERGDNFFLLNCACKKNSKIYFSNIPIECNNFYKILNYQIPNFIDQFSSKLFNSEHPINEVNPVEIIATELYVDFESIVQPVSELKLCS